MICRYFEQACADRQTQLENEAAQKLGATRIPDPFGSNHVVLQFQGKVNTPSRIQGSGEFECNNPDCQLRGRTGIDYPNRPEHAAALSRSSSDTFGVYDPARGEYIPTEVINQDIPHCRRQKG